MGAGRADQPAGCCPDELLPSSGLPKPQAYGDLVALNTERLILDAVGREILEGVSTEYLDLLETSSAIYEHNGDYALGIVTSGWCRSLDEASRRLCATPDNQEALGCGKWHCHESCWSISRQAIDQKRPVDLPCLGGIRIYAVPILANGKAIGAINFGHGDPPKDPEALAELADRYQVSVDELRYHADAYVPRPAGVIAMAKRRLETVAKLLSEIVQRRTAEEALRESESRYRALFEQAPVGVNYTALDGRWLMANPAFCEILGYSQDELIGRGFQEFTHSDDVAVQLALNQALDAGRIPSFTCEKRYVRKDGSIVWANLTVSLVRDPSGVPAYRAGIIQDITERKRADEANARLAAIVSTSDDAIVSYAARDGRITSWNTGAERLFGYTEAEAIGGPVNLIVPESCPEGPNGLFECALSGKPVHMDAVRRRKDGTLVDVSIKATPMRGPDGKLLGVSAILRDITARKRAEHHHRLLVGELNHRVKNTLATVQSITRQTLRSTDSPARAQEDVEVRLIALSRVHDVLTRENWEGASLREIVAQAMEPYRSEGESRLHVAGPNVRLEPTTALALAMALQELATNAVKHGALSNDTGLIAITWTIGQVEDAARLQLRWAESRGPVVEEPRRRGFGSRLIERSLAQDLNGRASLDFRPTGVVCTIEASLAEL